MARNYKRDRRGRFAKVNGMKGSNPIGANTTSPSRAQAARRGKAIRQPISKQARLQRQASLKRKARIAGGLAIAGVATAQVLADQQAVTKPSFEQKRLHAFTMAKRVSHANARGLPQMHVAKRSRKGVYNVTTLK